MNNDCVGCPYNIEFGKSDRICSAPNGCIMESAHNDHVNNGDTGVPDEMIESLISGLLDD